MPRGQRVLCIVLGAVRKWLLTLQWVAQPNKGLDPHIDET